MFIGGGSEVGAWRSVGVVGGGEFGDEMQRCEVLVWPARKERIGVQDE